MTENSRRQIGMCWKFRTRRIRLHRTVNRHGFRVDIQVARQTGPLTAIVFYTRQKDYFAFEIDVDRTVVLAEKKLACLR
jgi:hypothetical protein